MTSKRALLIGLVGLAAGIPTVRYFRDLFEPLPEFESLVEPPGFRRISGGPSTSGFDPFVGLDAADSRPRSVSVEEVKADICAALYGSSTFNPDTVSIASFSDYYCPYCRVQTKRLADIGAELGSEVHIEWHELPLLGETSQLATRAALAAKRQGAYLAFHERLLSSPFQATPEYLERLSVALEIDPERLKADMASDGVARELDTSAVLSEIFAFIGTPAMVIGRTVIQGQVTDRTIRSIVDIEKTQDWTQAC